MEINILRDIFFALLKSTTSELNGTGEIIVIENESFREKPISIRDVPFRPAWVVGIAGRHKNA
jgi:hypothetical protein